MCEQTEIEYIDGDVVWVKLGPYWWPGQVVGLDKLPEDIYIELQKKSLIAVVKFFQENKFEFVKNYHQIYKYNCTQKEDFIKKGLDKYRTKSKDGSNYMDKFPKDVETAETLTNGDPNILSNEKFSPEKKPDISGLFGEKKISKKKRNRDDSIKKSDGVMKRKVTHPRFLRESDHEVRFRQQPKTVTSSSDTNSSGGIYPCHVCGFTTTRVNVIICHLKNHRQNDETISTAETKTKFSVQLKPKQIKLDSPKRKYVRKSISNKNKTKNIADIGKRKYPNQITKPNKKKKCDPELREKLLADWNVDSDEDESSDLRNSTIINSMNLSNEKQVSLESLEDVNISKNISSEDNTYLLQETDKILKETESFTKLKDVSSDVEQTYHDIYNMNKLDRISPPKNRETFRFKEKSDEKCQKQKDNKKSLLSCFDFDEDDIPEPNISPVRKIPRGLGNKNMSIKKEIIKEFEMSQALKNDLEADLKNSETSESDLKKNLQYKTCEIRISKDKKNENNIENENEKELSDYTNDELFQKSLNVCETQVEIVEIFEVDKHDEIKEIENDEKKQITKLEVEKNSISNVKEETNDFMKTKAEENIPDIEFQKLTEEKEKYEKIENQVENDIIELDYSLVTKEESKKFYTKYTEVTLIENDNSNFSKENLSSTITSDITAEKNDLLKNESAVNNLTTSVKGESILSADSISETQSSFDMVSSNSESTFIILSKNENQSTCNKNNSNSTISKQCRHLERSLTSIEEPATTSDEIYDEQLKSLLERADHRRISESEVTESDTNKNFGNENLADEQDNAKAKTILEQNQDNIMISDDNFEDTDENNKSDILNFNCSNMEKRKNEKYEVTEKQQNKEIDSLPPKKSQIKKFELSQTDCLENDNNLNDNLGAVIDDPQSVSKKHLTENIMKIVNKNSSIIYQKSGLEKLCPKNIDRELTNCKSGPEKSVTLEIDDVLNSISCIENIKNKSEIINSDKFESITIPRITKAKIDNNETDSFQEAFVKAFEINEKNFTNISEKIEKNQTENAESINVKNAFIIDTVSSNFSDESDLSFPIMTNFDSIEAVVAGNTEVGVKSDETVSFVKDCNITSISEISPNNNGKAIEMLESLETNKDEISQKFDDLTNPKISTTLQSDTEINIPVKKREKPRIIEAITLKKPMILKTKLIEKHSAKIRKHKLETDHLKLDTLKKLSNVKKMKIETVTSTTKNKSQITNVNKNPASTNKSLEISKNENNLITSVSTDVGNEQIPIPQSEISSAIYVQQSSQSLVNMELDINAMPFVLSEDVLTPENIEQMPVLISSILPTTNSVMTTSMTSTTLGTLTNQLITINHSFESSKEVNEISLKKKSGTPTILKNKTKAKPTITSIKNIVPPLTSASYKGYKFNVQALKTSLNSQKTSGKCVIVQTSGDQQAYSTHQKITISGNKGSGNPQIVQQGGKVVILTSSQSRQPGQKIFDSLNSIRTNNAKMQRNLYNKEGQQMYTISPQTFGGSETILTSKVGEINSLLSLPNQKIVEQIIPSKSVSSQVSGAMKKSPLLGKLPQRILTKEDIFTPINSSTVEKKTIVNSKAVGAKGLLSQNISVPKHILSPMQQSLVRKKVMNSQGIVSKRTILTPVTVSQVKALAAKNMKGNKSQYQTVQCKEHVATIQKSQNVSTSPVSQSSTTNLKSSKNVVLLQNAQLERIAANKKIIKQSLHKQPLSGSLPLLVTAEQQKVETVISDNDEKISSPKSKSCIGKLQDEAIIDDIEENMKTKKLNDEILISKTKIKEQQRQIGTILTTKANKVPVANIQKKLQNLDNKETLTSNTSIPLSLSVSESATKVIKKKEIKEQIDSKDEAVPFSLLSLKVTETEKLDELKVSSQNQIMALSTENSEGMQAYVLVTIDEQGHVIPLDNNAFMSLDETSNFGENKTFYIDSNSLSRNTESENIDNIVLQIDNASLSNFQTINMSQPTQTVVTQTLPSSATIKKTTNQDILAAALANTDFQHEISINENPGSTAMSSLTQKNLINQTILQSTIIPPTEPISSPLVLETSLTLNQPIMTPLEVPSNMSIQPKDLTPATSVASVSLGIPVNTTNQNISNVITEIEVTDKNSNDFLTKVKQPITVSSTTKIVDFNIPLNMEYMHSTNLLECTNSQASSIGPQKLTSYTSSESESDFKKIQSQTTPSMPIIDFNTNSGFDASNASIIVEDHLKNFVTKTSEELIQDLTESDSFQEGNEILGSSSDKTYEIREINMNTRQIILSDTQNNSVLCQENSDYTTKDSQKKVTTTVFSEPVEPSCSCKIEKFNVGESAFADGHMESITINKQQDAILEQKELISCHKCGNSSSKMKSTFFEKIEEKKIESDSEEITNQSLDQSYQDKSTDFKINIGDRIDKLNQETSKLISTDTDVAEVSGQSVKSKSWHESTLSLSNEDIETDQDILTKKLPTTHSYEFSRENKASQSWKNLDEISNNDVTQSFTKTMNTVEVKEESSDGSNFRSQSYKNEKVEIIAVNMETDSDISEEGNIPLQSTDIGVDSIGTSALSTNNCVLNEDETASSSYVPETPENQERDQDQESAISTSSYEIPPCDELNIASSSAMVNTLLPSENSSIHNKEITDMPEIPTPLYNLNPNSKSMKHEGIMATSIDNQLVEQKVSTYEVAVSLDDLEKKSIVEKTEPTSYFDQQDEVSEIYYDQVHESSETCHNYLNKEEQNVSPSPSYYGQEAEGEASQSYYLSHDLDTTSHVSLQNIEGTQSFYQENDCGQEKEGVISSYTDSYSINYDPDVSLPLDRHDLVESSMPPKSINNR